MSINLKTKIVTTTPYTILPTDEVIFVNVAGPASIVLPSNGEASGEDCCGNTHDDKGNVVSVTVAVGVEPVVPVTLHRSYYIKDFSGLAQTNPITITSAGGKSIDGINFAILNGGYSHIKVVYDGRDWKTIA